MNITVLGLTNPDVNLKRMHKLYTDTDIIVGDLADFGTKTITLSLKGVSDPGLGIV